MSAQLNMFHASHVLPLTQQQLFPPDTVVKQALSLGISREATEKAWDGEMGFLFSRISMSVLRQIECPNRYWMILAAFLQMAYLQLSHASEIQYLKDLFSKRFKDAYDDNLPDQYTFQLWMMTYGNKPPFKGPIWAEPNPFVVLNDIESRREERLSDDFPTTFNKSQQFVRTYRALNRDEFLKLEQEADHWIERRLAGLEKIFATSRYTLEEQFLLDDLARENGPPAFAMQRIFLKVLDNPLSCMGDPSPFVWPKPVDWDGISRVNLDDVIAERTKQQSKADAKTFLGVKHIAQKNDQAKNLNPSAIKLLEGFNRIKQGTLTQASVNMPKLSDTHKRRLAKQLVDSKYLIKLDGVTDGETATAKVYEITAIGRDFCNNLKQNTSAT